MIGPVMLPAVSEVAYPVIEFSQGHLVVVHDEIEMRRCTRAGVRRGWFDDLEAWSETSTTGTPTGNSTDACVR